MTASGERDGMAEKRDGKELLLQALFFSSTFGILKCCVLPNFN